MINFRGLFYSRHGWAHASSRVAAAALAGALTFGQAGRAAEPMKPDVRLIGGARAPDHAFRAAIAINLPPGAITYWRNPGDAGVPPRFDFSDSENILAAQARLPAPERIVEADGEAFGYRDSTLFFISATPRDPKADAKLKVNMDYAICERLCLPARARLELDLSKPILPTDAASVDQAEKALPVLKTLKDVGDIRAAPGAPGRWSVHVAGLRADDLFVEPLDESFIESKKQPDGSFLLTRVLPAKEGRAPIPVRLTAKFSDGAIEFDATLQPAAP